MNKKTALWIKILVPVLIVITIGGMWIYKSKSDQPAEDTPASREETDSNIDLKSADFSLNATKQIDFVALSEYGFPIIVDYGSDSCIPCKQMKPVLVTLNAEMKGKAFIKFVDVWEYDTAANNVPIQLIPSQVLFNADGTPYIPSDALKKQIGAFKFYNGFTVHEGGLTEQEMRQILAEMGVE